MNKNTLFIKRVILIMLPSALFFLPQQLLFSEELQTSITPEIEKSCVMTPDPCLKTAAEQYKIKQYDEAIPLLKLLIEQPATKEKAGILLSKIYLENNMMDEVGNLSLMEDYRLFFMSKKMIKLGRLDTAYQLLFELSRYPDTVLINDALFLFGETAFKLGDYKTSRDAFKRFYKLAPQDKRIPSVLFYLSEISGKLNGNKTRYLKKLWFSFPNTPEAIKAEKLLSEYSKANRGLSLFPTKDDLLAKADALYRINKVTDAASIYEDNLTPVSNDKAEETLRYGIALFRQKKYSQSRLVLEALVKNTGKITPSIQEEALYYISRIYFNIEEEENFTLMFTQFAERFPNSQFLDKMIRMASVIYTDKKKYNQADEILAKHLTYPLPAASTMAVWEYGWIKYITGNFAESVKIFDLYIPNEKDPEMNLIISYWKGRAYEKLSDWKNASIIYKNICSEYIHSSYCHSAIYRLSVLLSQNKDVKSIISEDELTYFINPLQSVPEKGDYDISSAGQSFFDDIHYLKLILLNEIGLDEEAQMESAYIVKKFSKEKRIQPYLSYLLENLGDYYNAARLPRIYYSDILLRGSNDMPGIFWEHAYSKGYSPIIKKYSRGMAFDNYLVSSIIKEESAYNKNVVSSAGAVGLMQLMSYTAKNVASQLSIPEFNEGMLVDEEQNIKIGTYYLNSLLDKFDDNLILAIAAYNAGPNKVEKWTKDYAGTEADEFIQFVPYKETRLYIRKVLRSYIEYLRVYSKDDTVILNAIRNIYGNKMITTIPETPPPGK